MAAARSSGARLERLVVRAPNHLGETVLALPALRRLADRAREAGDPPPLVLAPAWLRPVLALADLRVEIVPLPGRRALVRGALAVRRAADGAPRRAIALTPSFSSAVGLRLAGVRALRGTATDARGVLLTDPVDRGPLLEGHRVNEFLVLCGFPPEDPPEAPRLEGPAVERAEEAWRAAPAAAGALAAARTSEGPVVGLFPGANGPARRWPDERYGALALRLGAAGAVPLVFGGPDDVPVTAAVAGRGGDRTLDLGGRTSLTELAGALRSCDLLVTNDTGPMHLAAALGTPVLALEGPADLRQTRPLGARVRVVGRFDLPCVPCVKNACPRSGAGFELPEAERECMRLIEVDEVEAVVNEMWSEESA
ncbi:MAG: glycosyltransferase family 9 protein [Gemmatimonadales bacterium]|jgi:lipopolysaccharide heptosyltransferase II